MCLREETGMATRSSAPGGPGHGPSGWPPTVARWGSARRRAPRCGEPGYVPPTEAVRRRRLPSTLVIVILVGMLLVSLAAISYTSRVNADEASCRAAYRQSQAGLHGMTYGVYRKTFC